MFKGDDFDHTQAVWDFENMDKIISYVNQNSSYYGVTLQYSTLGEYFAAVHAANLTFENHRYFDLLFAQC
jgi:epididymis-specific alpha-mannosidase